MVDFFFGFWIKQLIPKVELEEQPFSFGMVNFQMVTNIKATANAFDPCHSNHYGLNELDKFLGNFEEGLVPIIIFYNWIQRSINLILKDDNMKPTNILQTH